MTLGKLMSPLNLDLDELELELEWLPLYGEFAERFTEALDLVAAGIEMWRPESCEEWHPEEWAIEATAEVSRKLYMIEQALHRYPALGIAWAVRNVGSWDKRATDSQLAAALAMAYGCRAINVLRAWLGQLANHVVEASGRAFVDDTMINYPSVYASIIDDYRTDDSVAEIEARESAADLLGRARNSLVFAELYRHPNIPVEALTRIGEQAVRNSRAVTGRKAGERSGAARQESNAGRDRAICKAGRDLLSSGRSHSEISGIIAKRPVAEGLGSKSVREILRRGGVLHLS
ncbi:hypothetical protein [Pseudomonas cremoricolorata]|uniref:Uncharacterized protein n=1 Tax=Pseudomonas cremoricolorata TaxID=157783 RepID=A0A089WNS5_9PSED|nr:hypothetical protein [Pseudomonas cremoricolorata]AIR88132.1 hypothetical protein LK03_02220 [Pseudomonas cremoricolorata]